MRLAYYSHLATRNRFLLCERPVQDLPLHLLMQGNCTWEALKSSQPYHFPMLQQKKLLHYLYIRTGINTCAQSEILPNWIPHPVLLPDGLAPSYQNHILTVQNKISAMYLAHLWQHIGTASMTNTKPVPWLQMLFLIKS